MVASFVVASLVGQEAVTEVSKSLFQSITGIFYHNNPLVRELLTNLDIYDELSLIKTLINEINGNIVHDRSLAIPDKTREDEVTGFDVVVDPLEEYLPKPEMETGSATAMDTTDDEMVKPENRRQSETLKLCLVQLKDIVEKIYHEINQLNVNVAYHRTLWFNSFRTPRYNMNIENIKKMQLIMKSRFRHLIEILTIYKNTL